MRTCSPASDVTRPWLVVSLCATLAAPAAALEPPRPSVEEALSTSRLAFIARVQRLQEVQRLPTTTAARATLTVLKCLVGQSCQRVSTLQMDYTPETLGERALGVNFQLGREYLLVFKDSKAHPLDFGSDWSRRMDVAFVLKTPLQPLKALGPASDTVSFENIWGGPVQAVEGTQLDAWAARRRLELAGKATPASLGVPK